MTTAGFGDKVVIVTEPLFTEVTADDWLTAAPRGLGREGNNNDDVKEVVASTVDFDVISELQAGIKVVRELKVEIKVVEEVQGGANAIGEFRVVAKVIGVSEVDFIAIGLLEVGRSVTTDVKVGSRAIGVFDVGRSVTGAEEVGKKVKGNKELDDRVVRSIAERGLDAFEDALYPLPLRVGLVFKT